MDTESRNNIAEYFMVLLLENIKEHACTHMLTYLNTISYNVELHNIDFCVLTLCSCIFLNFQFPVTNQDRDPKIDQTA